MWRCDMRDERGQAVVEYAIMFPILLLVTLGIIQLSHLFVARHVVEYAAFCAARAMLVEEDSDAAEEQAEKAALIVCSSIAGRSGPEGEPIEVPGWGTLPRSRSAATKTRVARVPPLDVDVDPVTTVSAEVTHDFELIVPVVNNMVYRLGELRIGVENVDMFDYDSPHLELKARATLAKPWAKVEEPEEP